MSNRIIIIDVYVRRQATCNINYVLREKESQSAREESTVECMNISVLKIPHMCVIIMGAMKLRARAWLCVCVFV